MIQDILPHIYDVTYRLDKAVSSDIMLIYKDGALLCLKSGDDIVFPTVEQITAQMPNVKEKAKFMFKIDEHNYFELRKHDIQPFDGFEYMLQANMRALSPSYKVFAAATASHIHSWYTNTKFCGRCGEKMKAEGVERAMKCPKCGKIYYPQICPAVIVGVTNGDKLLLTKYAASHSAYNRYALIAGYAEVGESYEDTVKREVMEEVGLKVKNIRYFSSQPWSYTHTLLAGFFCDVDGDTDIKIDENELSVGVWLTRDEIPKESANASISLTGAMIKAFKENKA